MKTTEETKLAVSSTLDMIAEAFEERDLDKMMSLFSTEEDIVVFGTGADEKRLGKHEVRSLFKRDWSQSEESSITYNWKLISAEDNTAWVATDTTYYARISSREIHFPTRLTLVMKKYSSKWLIVHWHASLPAFGQQTGESWPINIPTI